MDLQTLNARELSALINRAQKRKETLDKRTPASKVKAAINRVLRESGWTLEELYGASAGSSAQRAPATRKAPAKKARRKLGKVEPKYRNPANSKETWTGRGKHPRWMSREIARGKRPEDFLISAAPTPKPVKAGRKVVKAAA